MQAAQNWILHDYLQVNGGAERLVLTLARSLPDFRLGISAVYPDFAESGDLSGVDWQVADTLAKRWPRIPRALMTFGQGRAFFRAATDCVIYSGLYAPLAVSRQNGGRKIYYCHTPPRFAFDWQAQYLLQTPAYARPLLQLAIGRYRQAYLAAVRSMDIVVTNSMHVRDRLRSQTGVEARVIYPPIDTQRFRFLGQDGYYLSVGRLEPNKRIERIVRAFLGMPDKKLVVASGGFELAALKALAVEAPNIRFTGWLDDAALAQLVGNAIAVIYIPRDEDFGMSAVEAMAAGKPLIGVDEGGLKESVIDGCTGLLLPANPPPAAIAAAVMRLPGEIALGMRPACERRAVDFSTQHFVSAFKTLID